MSGRLFSLVIGSFAMCCVCSCRSLGKVDSTKASPGGKPRVLVGAVLMRDLRYNPYMSENLKSAILFNLEKRGFDAVSFAPDIPAATNSSDNGRKADSTADLLPKPFANAAGESRSVEIVGKDYSALMLDRDAVNQALNRSQAAYFIQGFVAREEVGTLLELHESYFAVLDVYGAGGKKQGAISFTVTESSLTDSSFLTFVAQRIGAAFEEKLAGQNSNWSEPGCIRLRITDWFGI